MNRPAAWIAVVALAVAVAIPAVADDRGELAVRFALVLGNRGEAPLPEVGAVLSERLPPDYLTQWDPNADNPEIQRIFALGGLSEVTRQAARLPAAGGGISGSTRVGDRLWRVELEARARAAEEVLFEVRIFRDGELISAPSVLAPLGERAIVSAGSASEPWMFFLVVQADRWPAIGAGPARGGADAVGVTQPKLLHSVSPDYPPGKKANAAQGVVLVALSIDVEGMVRDARIERSLGPEFDQAALAAVRQWRFEPARSGDEPVPADLRVTINFVPPGG